MKKVLSVFAMCLLLLSWTVGTGIASETTIQPSAASLDLTEGLVSDRSGSYDVYFNSWGSQSFINTSKEVVTKGVGFSPNSSSTQLMWVKYDISDYKFTTFESKISIDNNYKIGSRGKTEFIVYADNKKLYNKTFSNTTPAQKLRLSMPAGTKSVTLMAVMEDGSIGNHRAIFGNPKLTNSLSASSPYTSVDLGELETGNSNGYDVYRNAWNSFPFQLANGSLAGKGYGFEPNSSSTSQMWAQFNISDYNLSTLETTVSLDNKWKLGDRGRTQFIIYADDRVIYSETFYNNSKAKQLKIPLPSGTQHIRLMAVVEKGKQGNHAAIFADPVLTNNLAYAPSSTDISLYTLGLADYSGSYDVYTGNWNSSPFQLTDGKLTGYGYGFKPNSSSTKNVWAQFYINDYKPTKFETTISLENKWRSGDKGNVTVSVVADSKVLYQKTFSNSYSRAKISVNVPKGATYLYLKSDFAGGLQGTHGVIFDNPIVVVKDTKKPLKPVVNPLSSFDTKVTGKTELGAKVVLKKGTAVLGQINADKNGGFSLPIAKQPAGTVLTVTAVDTNGNMSSATKVTVKSK